MPACNISCQQPAFRKDEKRGQKWARNSSPFLEPSSIGTITEGSENGPIFGPAFWCRRTTPELVLGVANLGTDREMPSNATSSSLDAAGQGKRPVTACLEHTFAFNSQVETCCVYSLTNCSRKVPDYLASFDQWHSCATLLLSLSLNPAEAQADMLAA